MEYCTTFAHIHIHRAKKKWYWERHVIHVVYVQCTFGVHVMNIWRISM